MSCFTFCDAIFPSNILVDSADTVQLILIKTGVTLPVSIMATGSVSQFVEESALTSFESPNRIIQKPTIICTHGLGPVNPKLKSHLTDDWIKLLVNGAVLANISSIAYTARGHGNSSGWEDSAESNPEQFQWNYLSHDMEAISEYYQLNKFIASGSSMGSATSLFAALYYPERVSGVIMIRPPTAWEERKNRRKNLLSSANKCRAANGDEKYHFVLRGTAYSDFPPLEDIQTYSRITCPVLILAVHNDESHPLSTAEALRRLLPNSVLYTTESMRTAQQEWPKIVSEFISSL